MEQIGNILEALRFASNQIKDKKMSTGMGTLQHAIETVNILWHIGKVQDQKILMAAILHQIPRVQDELKGDVETIFGKEVSQYIHASLEPASLKGAYFERLKLKKNKTEAAARQIYLAASAALLRHLKDQEDRLAEVSQMDEIKERQQYITDFSGQYEALEQFFLELIGQAES
ncbi:MAG: HD domain-containing protein [Bacteroidota bacterium]